MPTTYAHDLFGNCVYQRVKPQIREIINRNKMAYKIGLHGPDILFYVDPFYKNAINTMGNRMHDEKASVFFLRAKCLYEESHNEAMLAYILGFVCHFMLDSTCHPYVYDYQEKMGVTHDEIETEFDRALMVERGIDPFSYRPADVIHLDPRAVRAISMTLESVPQRTVRKALRGMRIYTGITVTETEIGRKAKLAFARAFFIYPLVQGRIIRKNPLKSCAESTKKLRKLFADAVPETVSVMESFFDTIGETGRIDERFNRNFNRG